MERRNPKVVKRRRMLTKQAERAETTAAANFYMALLARMVVGYDPWRETGSPRRG